MIKLNDSQQQAADAFRSFLASDARVLILKGAAGTGKTTLAIEFLRILDAGNTPCALMASTGRAAYIMASKTGRAVSTIHRGIYSLQKLQPAKSANAAADGDDDDGGMTLSFGLRRNDDADDAVYIVDEASMVSDSYSSGEAFTFGSGQLLTDLMTYAEGRKIVFIGDYAQLPPVGMNFSPALDVDYISSKFGCEAREVTLREVVRQQAGSTMLSNATRLRDCIEQKAFVEFHLDDGDDSAAADSDLLEPYFRLSPEKPCAQAAVVTYSNHQALEYNLAIRRHYHGSDAPRLLAGDLLMICRNNYAYEHELFNGNVVQVEACAPDSEREQRSLTIKIGEGKSTAVTLSFRKATIRFAAMGETVSLSVTLLDNFLDSPAPIVNGALARALVADFNQRLPHSLKSRLAEIRRLLHSNGRLTDEQRQLRDSYTRRLQSDPYYNAVVCRYGYAMTCHKAQGGEWPYVFVDMSRCGGTANETYFRWAYTALTRASKKIWHFRAPDFDYISSLVVTEIKASSNIKVSRYSPDADFCATRLQRLREEGESLGITVTDDRSHAYQHIVTFSGPDRQSARFLLWYKAGGYNGKETQQDATSSDFALTCRQLLEASFVPSSVPFEAPDRPYAMRIVEHMKSLLRELDIQLLDITQESYQDVFHLRTDGLAKVGLTYTGKGNYTYMTLSSTLGAADAKLEALRQKFL